MSEAAEAKTGRAGGRRLTLEVPIEFPADLNVDGIRDLDREIRASVRKRSWTTFLSLDRMRRSANVNAEALELWERLLTPLLIAEDLRKYRRLKREALKN